MSLPNASARAASASVWRKFETPPIQHVAAGRIDALVKALEEARLQLEYIHEKHGYAPTETTLTRIRDTLANVSPTPTTSGGE